ncbi:MAG: hypothetical protein OEW24_04245 [Chloroflexota bacterium]|nr:hypothetical protein [Chloroflexota bacterium]
MNRSTDPGPMDLLRQSNPVDADRLPSANLARVRARVQEMVMTDTQHDMDRELSPGRRRLTAGLVSVAALAAVVFFSLGSRGAPGVTPPDGGGGGTAMCIQFDLETLALAKVAFDGTVTAIDGDAVTFAVGHWYRGSGDSITLTEYGLGSGAVTLEGGVGFEVGGRYLVSGSDGIVTGCGFSQAYDDAAAADWASAFGG